MKLKISTMASGEKNASANARQPFSFISLISLFSLALVIFVSCASTVCAQQPILTLGIEPELPVYFVGQQATAILTLDAGGYELYGDARFSRFAEPANAVRLGAFTQRKSQNPRLQIFAAPMIFTQEGELSLAPALDGQVALTEMRGIFTSRRIAPFNAAATARRVRVETLPREGRPENFSGAIGVFALNATIEPRVCSPGDLLNLRWTLTGESAFNSPQTIAYSPGANFRVYPPRPGAGSAPGYVVGEQVVIPLNTNAVLAAALETSVFNPVKQAYETLGAGPFSLEISERAEVTTPQFVTNAPLSTIIDETKNEPFSFKDIFRRKRGQTMSAPARSNAKLLPDAHSKTLFEIPPGATLEIRARHDGWLFVIYEGASGWVPE